MVACYGSLSFNQTHDHQTPKPHPISFFIRRPSLAAVFHGCGFFHGVDPIFKFMGNHMNNEIEKKLIAIGVDLPQGVGDVTFVSKFNPNLLKNFTYLKLLHLLVIISLIFIAKYHLQTNDNSWGIHYYMLMFWIYVTGIIFFIKWFFWKTDVKIAGVNGFIAYGFRFSVKHPQKNLVLYKDIEKLQKYEGGDEWWRRYKSKYYQYDFIQNDKVVFSETLFWNRPGDDDLDFMDHVLENWKNSAKTATIGGTSLLAS